MENRLPRVSIGLAVYNGEEYLEEAIDSILGQTYTDFELIISDNASTDKTEEICRRYAAQDGRILYHRNKTNIGGANNENQTFKMSRGEYFRWAAHDDVCDPHLIEKCVAILDQNQEVVLCYSQIITIDEKGNQTGKISRNNADSTKPYERFATIAISRDFCEETYGLMRSDVLRKTRLQQNYTASDRTLLCELSLYGQFYEVPETLFFKRFHAKNVYKDWRTRMAWFDNNYKGKIVLPFWMQLFDYFMTIHRAAPTRYDRLRCYLFMLGWFILYSKNLLKDLFVAGYMLFRSPSSRKKMYTQSENWV